MYGAHGRTPFLSLSLSLFLPSAWLGLTALLPPEGAGRGQALQTAVGDPRQPYLLLRTLAAELNAELRTCLCRRVGVRP